MLVTRRSVPTASLSFLQSHWLQLSSNAVVNVWKAIGDRTAAQEVAFITAAGYKAITSACWYLNVIKYGENWAQYYQCDPQVYSCVSELYFTWSAAAHRETMDAVRVTLIYSPFINISAVLIMGKYLYTMKVIFWQILAVFLNMFSVHLFLLLVISNPSGAAAAVW